MDDDADTVVTTTDVGHGYTDDGALSLQSGSEGGGRSSRAGSHGMTMEEVERATREMLLLANAANAASSKVSVQILLQHQKITLSCVLTWITCSASAVPVPSH